VRLISDFFLQENRKFPTKKSEYSYKDVIQIFEELKVNINEI
jgi:hypothetical protein